MSKDKYPSKFSRQMEAIVFIILQIFFTTRAILKIVEHLTTNRRRGGQWPVASRLGKYPTLATETEVNSCFSIY